MIKKKQGILRGGIFSLISGVVSIASGLIIMFFAARLMDKEDIGVFFLYFVAYQVLIAISDGGLKNLNVKTVLDKKESERKGEANKFFSLTVLSSIFVSIVVTIIIYAIGLNEQYQLAGLHISYMLSSVVMMLMLQSYQYNLVALGHADISSDGFYIYELIRVIVSVLGLYLGGGLDLLLLAFPFSLAIALLWMCRKSDNCLEFCTIKLKDCKYYTESIWLWATSITSVFSHRIVDFMVAGAIGLEAMANYSMAQQIPASIRRVFDRARPYLLSIEKNEEISKDLVLRLNNLLVGFISLILILLAQPIVSVIYGYKYIDISGLVSIFSFWMLITLINYQLALKVIMMKGAIYTFYIGILQFLVVVVCLSQFLEFGVGGAVSALSLSAFFGVVTNGILLAVSNSFVLRSFLTTILQIVSFLFLITIMDKTDYYQFCITALIIYLVHILLSLKSDEFKKIYITLRSGSVEKN